MTEIHLAGNYLNGFQRCQRCGEVLVDYRDARVQPAACVSPFPTGTRVEILRGKDAYLFVVDDSPTCDEVEGDTIESHDLL